MSKIEKSDLPAGGDAPPIEAMKIDCANNTVTVIEVKNTDVMLEDADASAKEVVKEVLNARTEKDEQTVEAINNAAIPNEEEVIGPDAHTPETTDVIAEIAHVTAENDVEQIEAQRSVEESNDFSAITLQNEETPQSKSASKEKSDTSKQNASGNNATCISRLEAEVRKRTKECDSYRKKLEDTESKLVALQESYDTIINHSNDEDTLQQSVEQLRGQLVQTALMYEERNRMVANQENQINALNNQVTSLKEVVSITRDLLQIRNMEVKQLQAEVDNMEKKISEERDRHNEMISKMDAAMRLNADLKKEYETQLSLFQSLREKYGEKITLLSKEKQALEMAASAPE
ncbi:leucine-rich repeat and coiled-coil domain-containing protein 1 isoform X2 [Monomorium pharaonis]|uniref:leucine-rich repeat and coiled-coil domain-containing protein 1 isoform X2 n=1 Tax=Monomorium pharaonis TaxID=307658 RepID=UPI00063F742D|nr:leucine-rich repeat and coiled-coil domain-containing protein 1 isoform X2 [Monomorium pharaonis]